MIRKTSTTIAALAALAAAPAHADSGWGLLNMPQGVTDISRKIYDLHMLIFWVCVVIGVFVFAWMIWSIVAFRKSKGAVPDTTLTHSTKVEIVWTVIPVIILVSMAVPAAKTLVEIEDTRGTELTIKVTGYQWKWQYEYVNTPVGFFSTLDRKSNETRQLLSGLDPKAVPNYLLNVDNALVVPADTKVRLLITGQDVIHSWWVPAFGLKKDAIPGFVNELWFKVDADKTGTYRGQCVELCGRDHGFMPIVVEVKSKADFDAWLKARTEEARQAAAPAEGAPAPAAAGTNTAAVVTTAAVAG